MQKVMFLAVCLLLCAPMVMAQSNDKHWEAFVGYSNLQAEGVPDRRNPSAAFDRNFFDRRKGLHGVNGSVTGYMATHFGLTGDFSFNRSESEETFTGGRNTLDTRVTYFMGGPQFKLRSGGFQPFGRALAGGANTRFEVSTRNTAGTSTGGFDVSATDFAVGVGGGLDIKLGDRIGLRVFQIDYTPVFLRDRSVSVLGSTGAIQPIVLEGQRQDNVRFSFGIVF